jgi:probable phosphoglycerate mutase
MILLLRHGETEWNQNRRIQGRGDSPLTERGKRQAAAMGRTTRQVLEGRIPHLKVSPLGRTRHTAEIVLTELGLENPQITFDEMLVELGFGPWEGRQAEETLDLMTETAPEWRLFNVPGGETYEELCARCRTWLDQHENTSHPLVVVSHGLTGKIIRGLYGRLSDEEIVRQDHPQDAIFRLYQGSVTRIPCEEPALS